MAEVRVETILPLLQNVSDMSGKAFTVYNKTTGVAHGLDGQVLIDLDASKVDKVAGSRLINTEEITKLAATSGTNTGDETKNSIEVKLGAATVSNDGFLKKEDFSIFSAKEDAANKSNNVIADASSTTKFPTVKSIKDYADGLVVGLLDDRGSYDASSNQWPTAGGSGTGGAVLKGDLWYISVEGTLGGVLAKVGYSIRALFDSPGQTASNWDMMNTGIGYVPENIDNKATVINSSSTDVEYPTAKAVYVESEKKINKDGSNSNIDTLHFNPETLQELANIGDVRYSPDSKTLEVKITDTCTIQVGQEMTVRVKKGEADTMLNGKVVYISGALGANPVAKYASTADPDIAQRTFAVLTEDNPDFGIATTEGLVRDINTAGIAEGSLIWLSTNGNFTSVEPIAPTPKVCIGMCLRQSATVGIIYVKIRAISRMAKLSDVFAPSLTSGDILRYNATNGRFESYNLDSALALKLDKTSITNELGDSEELVVSQKGVSDKIKTPIENTEQAAAASLVELKKEVEYLRGILSNVITYLQISTLSVDNLQIKGAPLFIFSDVIPAVVPDFAGQIYIKTTATAAVWIALGDSSVSNWKEV